MHFLNILSFVYSCRDLPIDGARDFYTTQGLQEGQAPSSVHFNGLISDTLFIVVVSVLFILVVILSSLVIFMYVRLRRLDKKPRIRRRVIVSRNNQRERGSSVCELIDIENCCNMNECETVSSPLWVLFLFTFPLELTLL